MTDPETTPPERDPNVPPATEMERRPALGETVGTGTSIALGCVAATLLLIVLGLVFIVVVAILN
jgi:hypothetical protein